MFFQKKLSVKNNKSNVVTDITKQSSYVELNLKKQSNISVLSQKKERKGKSIKSITRGGRLGREAGEGREGQSK